MTEIQRIIPPGHPNNPGLALNSFYGFAIHFTGNDNPGMDDVHNAAWAGRAYEQEWVQSVDPKTGLVRKLLTNFEFGSKNSEGIGKEFAYGAGHVYVDQDSITRVLHRGWKTWHVGDRRLPYEPIYKGQQHVSKGLLHLDPNSYLEGVEICNNDVIKNSDQDWYKAVDLAKLYVIEELKLRKVGVNIDISLNPQEERFWPLFVPAERAILLRHYDVSGKICPKPFIDKPADWVDFVHDVAAAL